ncbi:CoA-transferase III family protein [Pleurotus pulmonarius]
MALTGLKVVEFAGLAPGPFAGLILADNGASVTRVDKPSTSSSDVLCRGKRSIAISPKVPSGLETLRKLIMASDVLIEPFRPGVMERLGLGPDVFLGDGRKPGLNEKLIYARIVGFPRTGPHKNMAGHDINYLALSGVLSMLPGPPDKPSFPANILADFAGGGLMGALGIMLAIQERARTGKGKVVNIDMVSGVRYISSFPLLAAMDSSDSTFGKARGTNVLDGGAPFYNVYTCKDGRWMSALPVGFALDGWRPELDIQGDRSQWDKLKAFLGKGFMTNTRDYWVKVFEGSDACTLPVLSREEAADLDASHSPIPVPHPLLHTTTVALPNPETIQPGSHTHEILSELGLDEKQIIQLASDGALGDDIKSPVRTKL